DAVKAIAKEALKRNTGARGLRAIIEDIMLDVMYDIPSRTDVSKCVVTKDVVAKKEDCLLVTADPKSRRVKKEESA
ncbi:MAG TPA: ATP-dependent Clp protease ATP-binding subunit ClpX, partial [Symbiobacteriaceae bacterium]|nr:ATP-dependent Clp protease ATP-binding subunit ClpX [Symbiobacteriaceae bacterium]